MSSEGRERMVAPADRADVASGEPRSLPLSPNPSRPTRPRTAVPNQDSYQRLTPPGRHPESMKNISTYIDSPRPEVGRLRRIFEAAISHCPFPRSYFKIKRGV